MVDEVETTDQQPTARTREKLAKQRYDHINSRLHQATTTSLFMWVKYLLHSTSTSTTATENYYGPWPIDGKLQSKTNKKFNDRTEPN